MTHIAFEWIWIQNLGLQCQTSLRLNSSSQLIHNEIQQHFNSCNYCSIQYVLWLKSFLSFRIVLTLISFGPKFLKPKFFWTYNFFLTHNILDQNSFLTLNLLDPKFVLDLKLFQTHILFVLTLSLTQIELLDWHF